MLGRILLMWLNRKVCILLMKLASLLTSTGRRASNLIHLCPAGYCVSFPPIAGLFALTDAYFSRLEITVWVVPSLIENAVAVSCIGLVLGPMYPILMNHSTSILPKWLLTGCLGYIAGLGQAGSAVLPFITGLLASKFGIGSLQPLCVFVISAL